MDHKVDLTGSKLVDGDSEPLAASNESRTQNVPRQIWIVVGVLALEGFGNLLSIPGNPMALVWLLAKCLFITGLLRRWKWVFWLFLVIGGIHVITFLGMLPLAALINLGLIALTASAHRFYFPSKRRPLGGSDRTSPSPPA